MFYRTRKYEISFKIRWRMGMDQTSVEFKKADVSSTFIENIFGAG